MQLKIDSLTYLGLTIHELGDYNKAIDYHNQALDIAKRISDVYVECKCYTNLGVAAHSLGDYHKATNYHNKSLEIAKRIGDVAGRR